MRDRAGRILPLMLVALVVGLCGPVPVAAGAAPTLSATGPHALIASDCSPPTGLETSLPKPADPVGIAPDMVDLSGSTLGPAPALPVGIGDLRQRSRDVRPSRAPPRA